MIYHLDLDELIANLAFNLQFIFQSVHEYLHRGVDYHRFSFGAVWIVITRSFIFGGSEMGFKPIPLGLVGSFDLVFEIHLIGIYCCCSICSPPYSYLKLLIFLSYTDLSYIIHT
jgi:asparagine N-glycosylation enzyme membrane subunit Stt3